MTVPLFDDATLELAGMRRAKLAKLQAEMERQGAESLWLLGPETSSVWVARSA